MTASLKVARPESMDLDYLIDWSKNAAAAAQVKCSEAEAFFNTMKRHHESAIQLLARLQQLRQAKPSPESLEEAEEIVETWMEVIEAMEALAHERFDDGAAPLEDEERDILSTPEGQAAARELEAENDSFLRVYFHHKSRLGLKTQEEVEKVTGINRRHISAIERGRHRPQFRTIKKLADAFGIDVGKLMSK